MQGQLHDLEKIILLSVDWEGRIPFPQGPPRHTEAILTTLFQMEEKGILVRRRGYEADRPFYLTPLGTSMKKKLVMHVEEAVQGTGG